MKFSIKDSFSIRDQISSFPADLVTFTWEILNGKLHFLCSKVWKLGSALAKKKSFLTGIDYMAVLKVVNLQIFGVKSDLVFPNGSFSQCILWNLH